MNETHCQICGLRIDGDFCLAGHNQRPRQIRVSIVPGEVQEANTFTAYQILARETAIYPERGKLGGLLYTTIGLGGEIGEIQNKVKKILRDNNGEVSDIQRKDIASELGDILWYLSATCDELGIALAGVAIANIQKLSARKSAGTIGGSGDHR